MGRKRDIRVVLDTSVLLSAARGPLIVLATHRAYTIVWSSYMEEELRRKLLQIGWRPSNASALLEKMESLAQRVDHEQISGGNYRIASRKNLTKGYSLPHGTRLLSSDHFSESAPAPAGGGRGTWVLRLVHEEPARAL